MRRRFLLALLFALLPGIAPAATVRALPAASVPRGLDVWLSEDHAIPMIVMTASFPAGGVYDPAGKAGLAALSGLMLAEGSGAMNAARFKEALALQGARLSVDTGHDYTVVTLTALTANADAAFRLLGQALSRPRFDADALGRVRARMIAQIDTGDDDPAIVAERAFDRLFYNGHAYARPVTGDAESLSAVTGADARAFARAHWTRGGLKVALAGDIDAARAAVLLRAAFAALPAAAPPPPPAIGRLGAPGVHAAAVDSADTRILFGTPGIMRADPDYLAGQLAAAILGGGPGARLDRELHVRRNIADGIVTVIEPMRQASVMAGRAATTRANAAVAVQAIRDTLESLAVNGPTAQELADAKTMLLGAWPAVFASNDAASAGMGRLQRAGVPADYVARRPALIAAVSVADVRRVLRRLLDPARLTFVVAGPRR